MVFECLNISGQDNSWLKLSVFFLPLRSVLFIPFVLFKNNQCTLTHTRTCFNISCFVSCTMCIYTSSGIGDVWFINRHCLNAKTLCPKQSAFKREEKCPLSTVGGGSTCSRSHPWIVMSCWPSDWLMIATKLHLHTSSYRWDCSVTCKPRKLATMSHSQPTELRPIWGLELSSRIQTSGVVRVIVRSSNIAYGPQVRALGAQAEIHNWLMHSWLFFSTAHRFYVFTKRNFWNRGGFVWILGYLFSRHQCYMIYLPDFKWHVHFNLCKDNRGIWRVLTKTKWKWNTVTFCSTGSRRASELSLLH